MSEHVRSDMHPAQIQISQHFHAVWSESSLGIFWIGQDAKFLNIEDWSDYADVMQICSKVFKFKVFVDGTCQKIHFAAQILQVLTTIASL